jgi:chemotaxis-related protein WspB
VGELRNVIVFALGAVRYALELRWVREVTSLGFVTNVPTAPPALGGVCNLHGAVVPVIDLGALLDGALGPPPRQGDGAIVVETDGVVCALRIDQVEHVASLHEAGGAVLDTAGRALPLLDPARLVRRAIELVTAAGANLSEAAPQLARRRAPSDAGR